MISIEKPKTNDTNPKMTSEEFLHLGLEDIVYVKQMIIDSETMYVINAADGTPLSLMKNLEKAIGIAHHHDMQPVSVH